MRKQFDEQGYAIVAGLIAPDEIEALRAEFMAMKQAGPVPGHFEQKPQDPAGPYDPLREFPRIMNPHLINALTRQYLLDQRIVAVIAELLGEEPVAAQSMLYFKPPGARGQALHQDNFYLRVEPGTCIAAWIALDVVDRANGGLEVVPGTHRMDLFCPEEADPSIYFTREYVAPPEGLERVPADMRPGDVLFFNGSLVHGSEPNTTPDRFRRSLILHYAPRSAQRIATYYRTFAITGEELFLEPALGGGPCGTEADGPH